MYISLSSSYAGNACAINDSIKKYVCRQETQFFDWLVCSMKSINEILEGKQILFDESCIITKKNVNGNTTIKFKYLDLLISYHDITDYNSNSLIEITEKYQRRYERLLYTIQNEKEIVFIRYIKNNNDLDEEQIHNFYNNITKINSGLLFKFILISDCDELQFLDNLINKINFHYINLNNYIDDDVLNEDNLYFKIIKKYKCIYSIINNV
jgi:flavodoxin